MPKPQLPEVISEDEVGFAEYERIRTETLRRFAPRHDPHRRRQDPGPSPPDQHWHEAQLWDGSTRYVPGSGPSNDWVRHIYNPLDALDD
jgi:hypothetical protein